MYIYYIYICVYNYMNKCIYMRALCKLSGLCVVCRGFLLSVGVLCSYIMYSMYSITAQDVKYALCVQYVHW